MAARCPDTQWVLAGYSQGAMVVAEAVKSFHYDRVVYVALFADPKLSLPEGKGILPDACLGRNYSEYRVYVPNCRTDEGRLKARSPYVYGELSGKYGLWCAENDYICGSTQLPWGIDGHLHYDERISQLVGILRKRLPYHSSGAMVAMSAPATLSGVHALLSLDTYYARPGDVVTIDASQSFSLDVDISDYAWSIDGGEFYSTGLTPTVNLSFAETSEHTVRVRVTDLLDGEAEYESRIVVSDVLPEENFAAPVVIVHREGADVVLSWSEWPIGAERLWLRLNGFDLGYAPVTQTIITVQDIDLTEENFIEAAWSDDENIGVWGEISLAGLEDVEISDEATFDSPNTGVTLSDGMLPCFAVFICGWAIWRILRVQKYPRR